MSQITFSPSATVSRKTRFTMSGAAAVTAEGGRVGVGVDNNNNAFLVHEIGRQSEAVALGAVASAVACGVIPPLAVAAGFAEAGTLDALADAVASLKAKAKPETPAK
jgi:hypothetical protein